MGIEEDGSRDLLDANESSMCRERRTSAGGGEGIRYERETREFGEDGSIMTENTNKDTDIAASPANEHKPFFLAGQQNIIKYRVRCSIAWKEFSQGARINLIEVRQLG